MRADLGAAGLDEQLDVAILLTSELCADAVQHVGTELELTVTVDDNAVVVAVTDRGPARPVPNPHPARSTNVPGLVAALASAWGTRHGTDGCHTAWFSLDLERRAAEEDDPATPEDTVEAPPDWPVPRECRWLLHVPPTLAARLDVPGLVTELLRRLCDTLAADGGTVSVDYGNGEGQRPLAQHGRLGPEPALAVTLPVNAPLVGRLRLYGVGRLHGGRELASLSAQRIALAIESDWLRGADAHRRSWMSYLAASSELLAQSLDIDLTVALIPQIIVPRLGGWCAVHLTDEHGQLGRATYAHADETLLPTLRAWLNEDGDVELRSRLDDAAQGARPVSFTEPAEGVAVALAAHQNVLGTLTVGRPEDRSHTPEDVALIQDVARRAALAIANAQLNAAHVRISQTFQNALLPRTLPTADGVEFAAEYLPASLGTNVGGDFYDVLPLGEDSWLIAVGDVCGKGAAAAARTGAVRDVLRVLLRDGCSLERALELLNDTMGESDDEPHYCTVVAALVRRREDTRGLAVELVLAGQDQPLLVRPDGSVTFVGQYGTAVGLLPAMELSTTQHVLWPGEALVIYTDGVTERRRGDEFFGRARLEESAARLAGTSAEVIASALRAATEDFSPDPPKDDIALLVVRAT